MLAHSEINYCASHTLSVGHHCLISDLRGFNNMVIKNLPDLSVEETKDRAKDGGLA